MKNTLTIIGLTVVLALVGAFSVKQYLDYRKVVKVLTTSKEKLLEGDLKLGKATVEIEKKKNLIDELKSDLKDTVNDYNAIVKEYGEFKATLDVAGGNSNNATVVTREVVTLQEVCKTRYDTGMVYQALSEKELAATEKMEFSFRDHRLAVNVTVRPYPNSSFLIPADMVYRLKLNLWGEIVEVEDSLGTPIYLLNVYEVDSEGNVITKLNLNGFDVKRAYESPYRFQWGPYLDIGLVWGFPKSFGATVGLSSASYGNGEDLFMFGRLGANLFSDKADLTLTPVLWNFGSAVPVLTDLWVGAFVGYSTESKVSFGLSLTSRL